MVVKLLLLLLRYLLLQLQLLLVVLMLSDHVLDHARDGRWLLRQLPLTESNWITGL